VPYHLSGCLATKPEPTVFYILIQPDASKVDEIDGVLQIEKSIWPFHGQTKSVPCLPTE
jgi:hypothetical protein